MLRSSRKHIFFTGDHSLCVQTACHVWGLMLVIEPWEWIKQVHPSVILLSGLVYTETPLVLFGDVFRPQEVEVTDHGLGVNVWRHRGKTNTSGWRTCAIASKRPVSLHEPFQDCALSTPGLCATVCVNSPPSTLCAHTPAATPSCWTSTVVTCPSKGASERMGSCAVLRWISI